MPIMQACLYFKRLILLSESITIVIDSDNNIAFKKKARSDIVTMFHTRQFMFENVYMHHTAQKIDKLYKCAMKRLGPELFKFGTMTDDSNIETLLRTHPNTHHLMTQIDYRHFNHTCSLCDNFPIHIGIKESGKIEQIPWV
jgi:HD superfamily phosphohydrolase